ncbi:MAG: hypothetical protein VX834_10110 [Myxococcota bacterium]|nr:hypothetical protein [Myxococcota bacterium]
MLRMVFIHVLMMIVLVGGAAWADVPNPNAEPCSLEDSSADGRTCEYCSASYEDPDNCTSQYEGTEFTRDCRSGGGTFWGEVWCIGAPRGGCYGAPNGIPTQAWLAFLPFVGLVVFRIRRYVRGRSH